MEPTRILFVCTEMEPYLPASEIATIVRMLSQGIQDKGHEIRVFLPRYGCVNERRNQLHEVIRLSGMNLIIDDTDHPLIIKVASLPAARMQVYFIDNDDYFQRKFTFFDEGEKFFEDNDERSIFFIRGVLETVKKLRWSPNIVHCHGWFTALLSIFLKKSYKDDPLFAKTKIILSLYNEAFPQLFSAKFKEKMVRDGIKPKDVEILSNPSYENLMKLAIQYVDGVIIGDRNVDKTLESHAKSQKKSILSYRGENYVEAYNSFYNKIIAK
ncbi:MAG: glycogen/starch synthase [Prevotellaceae bacterium]|jgi:starch synthase|nr:glycogen/starch synthase [Prevotellaceae bacterium]